MKVINYTNICEVQTTQLYFVEKELMVLPYLNFDSNRLSCWLVKNGWQQPSSRLREFNLRGVPYNWDPSN